MQEGLARQAGTLYYHLLHQLAKTYWKREEVVVIVGREGGSFEGNRNSGPAGKAAAAAADSLVVLVACMQSSKIARGPIEGPLKNTLADTGK